ncbi:hypothetical protein C8R47DRAFT_1316190 [Mycena vitilis]|nr:hypothetical protein C8R47DRAFT_1316190 [Mycena vitilis]
MTSSSTFVDAAPPAYTYPGTSTSNPTDYANPTLAKQHGDYFTSSKVSPGPKSPELRDTCINNYDVYLGIDRSESMNANRAGNREDSKSWTPFRSRWDDSGANIDALLRLNQPGGDTPLGHSLWNQLEPYLYNLRQKKSWEGIPEKERDAGYHQRLGELIRNTKPRSYIYITDGEVYSETFPDEKELFRNTILFAAETLQELEYITFECRCCGKQHRQLGIQFLQLGIDKEATKMFHMLDHLKGKGGNGVPLPDLVDTTPTSSNGTLSQETLNKAMLGGILEHVDEQGEPEDCDHSPSKMKALGRMLQSHKKCLDFELGDAGPGCWTENSKGIWKRCRRRVGKKPIRKASTERM